MNPQEEPDYVPPTEGGTTTTEQVDPAVALATANARADAFKEIAMGRGAQPEPDAPVRTEPLAPLPTNPLDLLDAVGREKLELMRLNDPANYTAEVGRLAVSLAEQRVARQAAPLISGQASIIISNFKTRMASEDPYAKDVIPAFDRMIAQLGDGIRNLVAMTPAAQEQELAMRWSTARGPVLERVIKTNAKPEPKPLGGGSGSQPAGNGANQYEQTDPIIAAMVKRYKMTPEQIAEINAGVL